MSQDFGLSALGFLPMQQQDVISDVEDSLKTAFGKNINLSPESNFGQLVGIFSERIALLWQGAEAVYTSQSPLGAEGTSVDNILALNALRRIGALPTRTNPAPLTQSNGIKKYGLVLFGTPGTVIPAGKIIQTQASPPLQFSIDNAVTILAAVNALQSLFMSNTPDSGAFQFSLNGILTPSMAFDVIPQSSVVTWASVPSSGVYSFALSVAGVITNTPSLNFNATASQIQTAIRTMSGYGAVNVSGSYAGGFVINWGNIPNPIITINTNTTSVSVSFQDSLQSAVNNLFDGAFYPYTDVSATTGASGFDFQFGAFSPAPSQASSGAQAQPLMIVEANTLQNGLTVTNLNFVTDIDGAPAQGIGTATCTATGPNFVAAEAIDTISTAVGGWTGVENQLDCITGSDIENDTQAMIRRSNSLQAKANGPLASIRQKVSQLADVTAVVGFENLNEAALQVYTFNVVPSSGKYNLNINGTLTADINWNDTNVQIQTKIQAISGFSDTIVTGDTTVGFTIDFNGSLGGQAMPLTTVTGNTTGSTITFVFGRPGHSFEIVVNGGDDTLIAQTILASKPAGIQSYGSTTILVYDDAGNPYNIKFSRPTPVPIYVSIVLVTDFTQTNHKFNPASITTIQQDIVDIGNGVSIGGLIIGFGSNGLIGAFNNVPGILSYTLFFGRTTGPVSNVNIQMQPEEVPVFESFNVAVSYS